MCSICAVKCKIISSMRTCLVVVFDRPCSKFVVLLLFRLYSCTFVNVYAVNGMSFTLFWGGEKAKIFILMCVYSSLLSP